MMDTCCLGCSSLLEIDWFCPSCNCRGTLNKMGESLSVRELEAKLEEKDKEINRLLNILDIKNSELISARGCIVSCSVKLEKKEKNLIRANEIINLKDETIAIIRRRIVEEEEVTKAIGKKLEAMEKAGDKMLKALDLLTTEKRMGIAMQDIPGTTKDISLDRVYNKTQAATEDFKRLKEK